MGKRYVGFVLTGCFVLMIVPVFVSGAVITVRQDGSGDYLTITEAVAAAAPHDTIDVGPGIYYEKIETSIIPLRFFSQYGPEHTILDGRNSDLLMAFSEGSGSEVSGFKFTNGYKSSGGALRVANGATVSVDNCIFENNSTWFDGGAFFVRDAGTSLNLENCLFIDNHTVYNGGAGNVILGGRLDITRCIFLRNSADIECAGVASDNSSMHVTECIFSENSSGDISGGVYYYCSNGLVQNNTFHNNTSPGDDAATVLVQDSPGTMVKRNIFSKENSGYALMTLWDTMQHSCNLFWNNQRGAIAGDNLAPDEIIANPLFCNPTAGDFSIAFESPAAPMNSPCGQLIGALSPACHIEVPPEEPVIVSILDVKNDQGRQVRIVWQRSLHDEPNQSIVITGYAVYRRQDQFITNTSWLSNVPDDFPMVRSSQLIGWDYVVTVPARGDAMYQVVVPTLCDSTEMNGICWSAFFISAMTPEPLVYFDSTPDSGYSVDNLPPSPPGGFMVSYNTASGNELSWLPSEDEDFECFRIYRGTSPDFLPIPVHLIHTTSGTDWLDETDGGCQYCYKISAVDDAGNESSAVSPEGVMGFKDNEVPDAFVLYQNVPNPFNPTTEIFYDVPAGGGTVILRIFDVRGRLIRTLVDAPEPAGRKRVQWDGRDGHGRRVASGIYFYRLQAPGYEKTLKMTFVQ